MTAAVRTRGLRELNRDLGKVSKSAQRRLQAALRALAEPVAADARSKASAEGWGATTVSGIRAGSSRGGAVVRQARRKTTGAHPDFGGLQMRRAFEPAVDENEDLIVRGAEDMLEHLTSENGLHLGGAL